MTEPQRALLADAQHAGWRSVPIPGSAPPVGMARLGLAAGPAFSALVRFPAGWARPGSGVYDVAEELLFLEGAFRMSGEDHGPGDYRWLPRGFVRDASSSPTGALALAWFAGPPVWTAGADEHTTVDGVVRAHHPGGNETGSPLGTGTARRLRHGPEHDTWIVGEVTVGAPSPASAELFSLPDRGWSQVARGGPLPALDGPLLCRLPPSAPG